MVIGTLQPATFLSIKQWSVGFSGGTAFAGVALPLCQHYNAVCISSMLVGDTLNDALCSRRVGRPAS